MEFDPNNQIVKLCALGMDMEGQGKLEEASNLFRKHGTRQQMTLKNLLPLIM